MTIIVTPADAAGVITRGNIEENDDNCNVNYVVVCCCAVVVVVVGVCGSCYCSIADCSMFVSEEARGFAV